MVQAPPRPPDAAEVPPPGSGPGRRPRWILAACLLVVLAVVVGVLVSRPQPEPTAEPAPEAPSEGEPEGEPEDSEPTSSEEEDDEGPDLVWVGTVGDGDWREDWGLEGDPQFENTSVKKAPSGGHGQALRISNDGGGEDGERWGFDGRFDLTEIGVEPLEEAYFRYYVWFPDDYEFDTQGKMPGLHGVAPGESVSPEGITCPEGHPYEGEDCRDPRGFGSRTMWKDGGMITYLGAVSVGKQEVDDLRTDSGDNYAYARTYRDADGDELRLKKGWNYVEQRVKLNTPGETDGIFEGWINGVRGVRLTNVQWRSDDYPDLRINRWNLAHFWGGPPSDYPEDATAVYYDDFAIARTPIGPRPD